MKTSKRDITSNASAFPNVRFENNSQLTSFAGIQIFSGLFASANLKTRLRSCSSHLNLSTQYSPSSILFLLITHAILGFSRLRDVECYQNDPLVSRFLGLGTIPSAPTVSRMLSRMDATAADKLVEFVESNVIEQLRALGLKRVTIDFDGSVCATSAHAEGTAVGFNPKKKGQRSYYPLFATISQLDQVLSVLHRSGNVHDSHKAKEFMTRIVELVRKALPDAIIEVRADSAFYSDEIIGTLEKLQTEFTISVPFERYANVKKIVEGRKRWRSIDKNFSGFERKWKADCWKRRRRFVFVKKKVKKQRKGPLQLDFFTPQEEGFEFTAIVTNKKKSIKATVLYHHGRGSQEKMFGELKNGTNLGYLPCRKEAGNRVYMLCSILAHNLSRALQIGDQPPQRDNEDDKRACLWFIESLSSLRKKVIRTAGCLTRPNGKLTLTIPADNLLRRVFQKFLPSTAFS
jgi:hypothetical protein